MWRINTDKAEITNHVTYGQRNRPKFQRCRFRQFFSSFSRLFSRWPMEFYVTGNWAIMPGMLTNGKAWWFTTCPSRCVFLSISVKILSVDVTPLSVSLDIKVSKSYRISRQNNRFSNKRRVAKKIETGRLRRRRRTIGIRNEGRLSLLSKQMS